LPLSLSVIGVLMTYDCPHCRSPHTKTGQWFISASHFRCGQCSQPIRLTYSDKVTLFERYARPTGAK